MGLPLSLALTAALAAAPQDLRVSVWTTADGLPQGTINEILQTSDGALWVATFGGLLRFDGVRFEVFDLGSHADLPSNRITALVGGGDEDLWAATQSGHLVRLRDREILESHSGPGPSTEFVGLARTDRALWLHGVSGDVFRFAGGQLTNVAQGEAAGYESLCVDSDGAVLFASAYEIHRLDVNGRPAGTWAAPAHVRSLAVGVDGTLWIGLQDGLARLVGRGHGSTIERVVSEPPMNDQVLAILFDETAEATATLWLGTPQGPRRAVVDSAGHASVEPVPTGLPADFSVRSLARDREGNVWVGSYGLGLARLTSRHTRLFASADGPVATAGLVSDGQAGAWIAFNCRGVSHVRPGLPLETVRIGDKDNACVLALLSLGDRVVVAHGASLLIGDERGFEPFALDLDLSHQILAVVGDVDGTMWVATRRGQLAHVTAQGAILEQTSFAGELSALALDGEGALWFGGAGTVGRWGGAELQTRQTWDAEAGIPRGDVRDLLLDPDGGVWIATYGGGLGYLRDGQAARITRAHGLPDASLTRILDDGLGRLWISSNAGLIVAEREDLIAVVEGRTSTFIPVLLGPEAGVPEANSGSPSGFRGEDGRLWFGTLGGAVVFDPSEFPFNRTPPTLRVDRVLAGAVELGEGPSVDVPAGTNRLHVEYTAFSLTAPERVRFRFRLDGFDEEWIDAGTARSVTYTALPPGPYTFLLSACNENGVWNETPLTLELRVLPSWWQTLWFRLTAAVLVVAFLVGLHRLRVAMVHSRAQALLEASEARLRAEERESRLREDLAHVARVATAGELATSLAHEVNQPLATMVTNATMARRLIERGQGDPLELDEILRQIALDGKRASEVIRRLRNFLRKHEAERRPMDMAQVVRDTMPLVRRDLADHGIDVVLDLDDGLAPVLVDPIQLQQVLVNLLKNACDSLARVDGARRVDLVVRADDAHVHVIVQDSGPGVADAVREQLFDPFVTTKSTGMGLGLAICATILEAHGGCISADETGARGGAAFRIQLPIERAGQRAAEGAA